jgi:molybdopterin-guanine dinucleotide biosynthesis protein A
MHNLHIETDERRLYPEVTGVILAGGRSVRMGRDKATLKWDGVTLFDRALALMQRFFPAVLIAGDRPDLARPGVPSFADPYPGSALGGLYTGLEHAATPWIFAVACDMPCAHPEVVRRLLAQRAGADAVVPATPAGPEPVFALYHRTCREPMRQLLEEGRFRISDLYSRLRVRLLECTDLSIDWERALRNVNTPSEFHRLKESGDG